MDPSHAKFCCGAECGIAALGTLSGGTEHWSAFNRLTVVTSGPTVMRSARCFRANLAASDANGDHTFAAAIASPATCVARFYVYFASLPAADCDLFTMLTTTPAVNDHRVSFHQTSGQIRAGPAGSSLAGVAVTTGIWYRIDMKAVFDTTRTTDVQVDGVACTQESIGGSTAGNGTGFSIGVLTGGSTADVYFDDILVSGTTGDYPIGAGTVFGLYPNGDRTNSAATPTDGNGGHLFSATTDFAKGASGATATGAQNAEATSWQSLAKPLSTSIATNWIADLAGGSAEHMVWTHDSLTPDVKVVNGVMLVAACHAASATACVQSMAVSNATPATVAAWTNLDLSESTITVPCAIIANAPGGAAWTPANINTSFFRWGDSTDVNPDPYLDGVCLEVDVLVYQPHVVQVNQAVQRAMVR